ncbi:Telomere length regulation protein elg1 [Penicillium subrubescens]|uniref:Telomere length regulation protein elg1 n=1 Tax=Penicillium subrubescens TaxID=1316194 RepID=A0A1Q5UR91_9EURO|nr:Telomere length regulation protein elg1 [Penicillium subrubescens]
MGQGEQPVVHPFFRKASAATSKLPPDVSSPAMTTSTPNRTSQMPLHYSLGLPQTRLSNTSSPDEDPNAGRRKRRKTERSKQSEHDQPLQAGLSGWLGVEAPASIAPKSSEINVESSTSSMPPPSTSVEPQPGITTIEKEPVSKDTTPLQDAPTRPQKIVKLNTNGRLLSSPPLSPPGTSTLKRASRKRGQTRKAESKMVVIKYALAKKADFGKTIDDILSGRVKHNAPSLSPAVPLRRPVQPKINDNKPTHPFFVKKATSKQPPVGSCDPQCTPKSLDIKANSECEQSRTIEKPLRALSSGFARQKNKFPELVHPVWPPRDFVHVTDLGPSQLAQASMGNLENDHKKSKSPTVVVPDNENTLLTSTAWARKAASLELQSLDNYKPALRLPGRHVASGRVLQAALDSQMSWSLPGQRSSCASSLPVIKRLHSSLLTSVSAFDCGKYESRLWAHKYSPTKAEDVLQVGREARMLRDWLRHLKVSAVDSGKQPKDGAKSKAKRDRRRKKRKVDVELDGFIVTSGEEASEMDALSGSDDELAGDVTVSAPKTLIRSGDLAFPGQHGGEKGRLTNAILISGPPGCGKTASVYAVAKELDFEVFELNPGSRRSARDMLEKVGDMTQNHLVHLLNEKDDSASKLDQVADVHAKQNKLMSFFKGQPSKYKNSKPANGAKANSSPTPETECKHSREQKQSLILLEEADLLFEEDRQFWTGVLTLISQSKRPIIITCNDESVVPVQDMSLHAILRYQRPPLNLALDYLLLVAAHEGHALKRDAVDKLYNASGMDMRRSLMDLNFWCQMAVGSEKGGLDWILPMWPPGANVDQNGERVRVLSLNTYQSYMGWFNRDTFGVDDSLVREAQALENTFQWWQLSIQDAEDAAGASTMEQLPPQQHRSMTKLEQLDLLSRETDYLEMRSSLDILCSRCPMGMFEDVLDTSAPPISESHRTNYTDAHLLLQADLLPEHPSLSESISTTFGSLISRVFRPKAEDIESAGASRIFNGWAQSAARQSVSPSTAKGFRKVFEPIIRANYSTPLAVGRAAPSFENGLAPITEDIAPYVRAILVFDGRLKEYRDNLFAAWSQGQGGTGDKRMRKTRASRAALEGGNKASTRKERWFPDDTNYYGIQGTGRPEWQQILFDMGYFHVQPVAESAEGSSESPSGDQT